MPRVLLSEQHVAAVCRPGTPKCCAYLAMGKEAPRHFCVKGEPDLRAAIEARLIQGQMGARGDNCSGPPDFAPPVLAAQATPVWHVDPRGESEMPTGPGKYDDLATHARLQTGADCVLVVVLGGSKGPGFSVQARSSIPVAALVGVLREVADQIETDAKRSAS